MENIKEIESDKLLQSIENIFNSGGIDAVKKYIETEFTIGTLVNLNQGVSNEKKYKICNYAIWQMNAQGIVSNAAYLAPKNNIQNCPLIRVVALSYISEPFQVEIYGSEIS